jgi:polyisoprenoid-binding protein YceI
MIRPVRCVLAAMSLGVARPALAQNPAPASAPELTNVWRIDRGHSELTFSIRHMASRVRGQFNSWSGTITGDLTMRGVTRPVVLEGQLTGTVQERGRTRVGFEASTTINRKDFGLAWNRAIEAGGWLLGDEVKIDISVAAVK